MSASKFNLNNPAVKRILQEVKEMQSNPSDDYMSLPLEDNIFEWQFAIRGPRDSEFEGGIYHGRIQLPPEYPFKPPAFMLLSPNGRFETQTKICLSISQYHPEHWQPSWSVRTALVALIAFFPTKGNGAIGSLDFTKEHRKALALKSVEAPPKYGSAERQKLIDEIHLEMIKRTRAVHEPIKSVKEDSSPEVSEGESSKIVESSEGVSSKIVESEDTMEPILTNTCLNTNEGVPTEACNDEGNAQALSTTGSVVSSSTEAEAALVEPQPIVESSQVRASTRPQASDDHFLTLLAIGLLVALAALMIRKFYHSFSWINFK